MSTAAQRRRKRKKFSLIAAAGWMMFLCFIVSICAAYVSNQMIIGSKTAELEALNREIAIQKAENEELKRIVNGDPDEMQERIARDYYGYARSNERIYVDISGK